MKTNRKLFLNLPVKDLDRSVAFFRGLGFEFDPRFTDEKATCMLVGEDAYVMLLREPFFKEFLGRPMANAHEATECIVAFSAASKGEVDEIVGKALATGGSKALDPKDLGFMYSGSFYDPDGHYWEVVWMDPAALQQ